MIRIKVCGSRPSAMRSKPFIWEPTRWASSSSRAPRLLTVGRPRRYPPGCHLHGPRRRVRRRGSAARLRGRPGGGSDRAAVLRQGDPRSAWATHCPGTRPCAWLRPSASRTWAATPVRHSSSRRRPRPPPNGRRSGTWRAPRAVRPGHPLGGLTPETVQDAIRHVRPYGVDLLAEVDGRPGVKDIDELERIIVAARRVE